MSDETREDLVARARARGLDVDDLIDALLPGVHSLSSRLRALGARLTPADATPAERLEPRRR